MRRATYLDLLAARYGAEDDLCKAPGLERPVADSSDDLEAALDDGERPVVPVVDESRDVLLGHHGQLLLEPAGRNIKTTISKQTS